MSVFRAYDIRGIADTELTNDFVWALGFALGEKAKKAGDHKAWIGRDVRLSSERLATALAAGFEAAGLEVRLLTEGPTPLLYFSVMSPMGDFKTSTGVMVTGSHNPPEYNGFKTMLAGHTIHGDEVQSLRPRVEALRKEAPKTFTAKAKTYDRYGDYIAFVKDNIRIGRPLKVVVDAGNGAGGKLGVETYKALGCDVVPLFCEPDGRFPNHHPDPTVPENLKHLIAAVREHKADLGIGFDGDADRIGAVTSSGQIMFGDHLVLYYSRDILKDKPGQTIISEVKSSQILYDLLAKWGGKPIMWKTGHSLIKAKLKEEKAALAGEMSGHIFFNDKFFGFDDAIYSGARLLEGLSNKKETLDEFMASLPPMVNTPELRVDCDDDKKFGLVDAFTKKAKVEFGASCNDIDGVRVKLLGGWALLRASNTQPVLVLRFEAPDKATLKQIRDRFTTMLQSLDPHVAVPDVM